MYRLETAAVNEHFFVMKLVTSAGAMVMLMLSCDMMDVLRPCTSLAHASLSPTLSIQTIGTYVKEFVHGDMGRTVPSIASILGCQVGCL